MDGLRRAPRGRALRPRAGFTLLELLVAMGILSVGLLALLALQVEALDTGRTGRHVTEAAEVARSRMEMFQRLDWNDPALQPTGGWEPAVSVDNQVRTPGGVLTEQSYQLTWRIRQDPTDTNLRFIDVRVTWNEAGAPANAPPKRFAVSSVRYNDP